MGDWFDEGGTGQTVDVEALLDSECASGLHEIVACGALLSMGLTNDGGALGITITVDGRYRRFYVRNDEDLRSWLAEAIPAARDAVERKRAAYASPVNGKRLRGR